MYSTSGQLNATANHNVVKHTMKVVRTSKLGQHDAFQYKYNYVYCASLLNLVLRGVALPLGKSAVVRVSADIADSWSLCVLLDESTCYNQAATLLLHLLSFR